MSKTEEEQNIVIVGAGICGLATALALHRKGIESLVLERSDTLRLSGAAIGILPNGWRALHQLGVDSTLRKTAIRFERSVDNWVDKGVVRETLISEVEARCLRRSDLIETLASALPVGTICFGCQVVSVHVDSSRSTAVLQLHDGSLIKAKVLIGCDGANSVISDFVGLKPTRPFYTSSARGLTIYPDHHGFKPEFTRIHKDKRLIGLIPIDEKTMYWFTVLKGNDRDAQISNNPVAIRQMSIKTTSGYSKEIVEMISNSELSTLSLTKLWYRAPWDLISGSFRRDVVTVAGDAWHVFGPFAGQGGSAALEDAVVLARCLSKKMRNVADDTGLSKMHLSGQQVKEALDEYLKERRMRVLHLSTKSYVTGLLLVGDLSFVFRFLCILLMAVMSRDPLKHTRYDCGKL